MKNLVFVSFLFFSSLSGGAFANNLQFKDYEETENVGLGKLERLDHIESYLDKLVPKLQQLQEKISGNNKTIDKISEKMGRQDKIYKELKSDIASVKKALAEEKTEEKTTDIEKRIQDLKENEIQALKNDLTGLQDAMRSMQGVIERMESLKNR